MYALINKLSIDFWSDCWGQHKCSAAKCLESSSDLCQGQSAEEPSSRPLGSSSQFKAASGGGSPARRATLQTLIDFPL